MSYSFTTSIGDGVTKVYPFSFAGQDLGYLAVSNVVVFVAGTPVPFTIPSNDPNKAYLTSAPPFGAEVLIRRVMPKNVPYSDFARGNPFSQDALNNTNLQQLYIVQEILDGYMPTGFYFKSDINMGGYKLVNLGEGTQAGDSVRYEQWLENKDRLDRLELGLVDNVAQRTIPWYCIATGGESELSPPYDFQAALVYRGGMFQNQGLGAFSITNNKIKLAEPLEPKEEFYALLGSSPAAPDDYAKLTEVIRLIEESKNTRELWRRSLAEIGLTLVSGSFREGAEVTSATDAVWDIDGAQCYTWTGDFPHTAEGEPGAGWVIIMPPSVNAIKASQFIKSGNVDDTDDVMAFMNYCVKNNVDGEFDATTYNIRLGEILLDNGHQATKLPLFKTSGKLTVFKAIENLDAPFIKITNGTATSNSGKFWSGGGLSGCSFLPAEHLTSELPNMHGLVLRGVEDAAFGRYYADGIGGNVVHIERALFGGVNPDPYHVNRCIFGGSVALNSGYGFYNDNYRGFAFSEIGNVFSNGGSGGIFGLGVSNNYESLGAVFSTGWGIGEQEDSIGGASSGCTVNTVELDNCQFGIDSQNWVEGIRIGATKIIHRYKSGANSANNYWPRLALRMGSSFRSMNNIIFDSIEDRIEPGGNKEDLGVLADFMYAGANLANIKISRHVVDYANMGITTNDYVKNLSPSSRGIVYKKRIGFAINTDKLACFVKARHNTSIVTPNTGFGTATSVAAYDTIIMGNTDIYDTENRKYITPATGVFRVYASLALTLPAGTRVRLGIFAGGVLRRSVFGYAVTSSAQTYVIELTEAFQEGVSIHISADQNSASGVIPGGTTGGADDSFVSFDML